MRKTTICLVAMLMCAWVSSFGQSNGLPQWKVVKEFHIIGATTGIGQTVLFTPADDGVYRLSGLMAAHAQQHSDGTYYETHWFWTDRAGNGLEYFLGFCFNLACSNFDQQIGRIFSPKVGTPVGIYLLVSDPPPPETTYDLVFTIEKLTR